MRIDAGVEKILKNAQEGLAPSKAEAALLLRFPEISLEASLLRAVADASSRQRFRNEGFILGQIGVEISACPGKCKFCSFGEGHTAFEPSMMSDEDILAGVADFTNSGELYALFLMTMHTFDFSRLLHVIEIVREKIPKGTQLVANIGDFDHAQAVELKASGVNGA